MSTLHVTNVDGTSADINLERLDAAEIRKIEDALKKVGPFGEVHLVVEKGRIRFVRTLKSEAVESENSSAKAG